MNAVYSISADLLALAERVDTGQDNLETSRALIVFNITEEPISGVAMFSASMSWPHDTPLPPVLVADTEGQAVPATVTDWSEGSDAKGRTDRRQVAFSLRFAVSEVPANGWRTYIASYSEKASPVLNDSAETSSLIVVETTRHGGDLPPIGTLVEVSRGQVE